MADDHREGDDEARELGRQAEAAADAFRGAALALPRDGAVDPRPIVPAASTALAACGLLPCGDPGLAPAGGAALAWGLLWAATTPDPA